MTIDTHRYDLERLDPDCLDPLEAVDLLRHTPWQRLVVLGDSVAEGVREPVAGYRDAGFLDRVAETLAEARPGFEHRNLGVRGLKIVQIHETQLTEALAFDPDIAIVAAGGNNALGRHFDPDAVRAELLALIRPLAAHGAHVVTIGLFDLSLAGLVPHDRKDVMTERFGILDAITAEITASIGGLHIDFRHHPRGGDPAIYASDRIHCNARGHAVAFAVTVDALARVQD